MEIWQLCAWHGVYIYIFFYFFTPKTALVSISNRTSPPGLIYNDALIILVYLAWTSANIHMLALVPAEFRTCLPAVPIAGWITQAECPCSKLAAIVSTCSCSWSFHAIHSVLTCDIYLLHTHTYTHTHTLHTLDIYAVYKNQKFVAMDAGLGQVLHCSASAHRSGGKLNFPWPPPVCKPNWPSDISLSIAGDVMDLISLPFAWA